MTQVAGNPSAPPQAQDKIEVMKELLREAFNNVDLDTEYWAEWRHRVWEVIRP